MAPTQTEYLLSGLRVEPTMLGEGGTANIYRCRTSAGRTMLFKRYNDDALKDLDEAALRRLIACPARLPEDDRQRLMRLCAWPQAVVIEKGFVIGVLMDEASPKFYYRSGKLCHFELIGVSEERAQKRDWPYYDFPHKVARLGLLLDSLQFLHSHDIIIGDLQIKNILTTTPKPDSRGITSTEILLLDCDSFIIDGHAALPPMDPPNMRIPHPVKGHSATTDMYKFALVVIRCLSETLSAGAIRYEIFHGILPTSSLQKIDLLLTKRNPGLTAADLSNMAKSWKASVKKDGRMFCRTDTSLVEKWTPEKRKAHLAGLVSAQSQTTAPLSERPPKLSKTITSSSKRPPTNPQYVAPAVPRPTAAVPAQQTSPQYREPIDPMPKPISTKPPLVVIGIVIAVFAVILITAISLSGNDSEGSSSTYTTSYYSPTTTAPTSTTQNSSNLNTLAAALSRGYSLDNCTPTDGPRSALATVNCGRNAYSDGPQSGSYWLYGNTTDMDTEFASKIANESLSPCHEGAQSPTRWHQGNVDYAGQMACRYHNGYAEVVWTNVTKKVLNYVQWPTSDMAALYKWWQNTD